MARPGPVVAAHLVSSSNRKSTPPVLTPATFSTVNKPLAAMSGSPDTPVISINKTWVLPPKPKPGRKPAVDTPPTKRKAQNREAQRAFRERRAAKVGELEEEMKKIEEDNTKEQEVLTDRISQLEKSIQEYGDLVESWRRKFNETQIAYGQEKQSREQAEAELTALKNGSSMETEAIPLPRRNIRKNRNESIQQSSKSYIATEYEQSTENTSHEPLTCGNCSNDTRCQCIEEAFEMSKITDETPDQTFKRPHSPPSTTDNKRICSGGTEIDESTEIDFTAQFSSRRPPALITSTSTVSSSSIPAATTAPPDPCGFCQDGSPCICSELAKDVSNNHHHQEQQQQQDIKPSLPQPPRLQPLLLEPQPTKVLSRRDSNPCINGPGTCAQCLSNPTSTLFCKSVAAANRPPPPSTKKPIPPTTLPSISTSITTQSPPPSTQQSTRLTCADAFTTLSRHPGFSAATDELNSWVPQLTAVPKYPPSSSSSTATTGTGTAPERTAFDIEAASVMSVLKFFDLRFGRDGGGSGDR